MNIIKDLLDDSSYIIIEDEYFSLSFFFLFLFLYCWQKKMGCPCSTNLAHLSKRSLSVGLCAYEYLEPNRGAAILIFLIFGTDRRLCIEL